MAAKNGLGGGLESLKSSGAKNVCGNEEDDDDEALESGREAAGKGMLLCRDAVCGAGSGGGMKLASRPPYMTRSKVVSKSLSKSRDTPFFASREAL